MSALGAIAMLAGIAAWMFAGWYSWFHVVRIRQMPGQSVWDIEVTLHDLVMLLFCVAFAPVTFCAAIWDEARQK